MPRAKRHQASEGDAGCGVEGQALILASLCTCQGLKGSTYT